MIKRIWWILLLVVLATGCSAGEKNLETAGLQAGLPLTAAAPTVEETPAATEMPPEPPVVLTMAEQKLLAMSTEEKVGQLFICAFRKDAKDRGITKLTGYAANIIKDYHIGGVVMFSENITGREQIVSYINGLQAVSEIPLLMGIDEEGGGVTRTGALGLPKIPAAGKRKNSDEAYEYAEQIALYLKDLGFTIDFAPVADVFSNPKNTVIGERSFGAEPEDVAEKVSGAVRGFSDNGMMPVLKHFPGHGDTAADSHFGIASTNKTIGELRACEFLPFQRGIEYGAAGVMVGHISTPNITGNDEPAIFSSYLLQDILRGELGFDGLIITDALDMGAVTKYYGAGETAVRAFLAGADILLMPESLEEAYHAVLDAVNAGTISEKRLDESVLRILNCKYN